MAKDDDRIERLEARVRELEGRLAALTVVVETRAEDHDTMRARLRCPACGGRRIFRVKKVADRDGGQQMPMAVSTRGLFFPQACGVFECDVCAACGLVEWHIEHPAAIDLTHEDIELIDGEDGDKSGPYR